VKLRRSPGACVQRSKRAIGAILACAALVVSGCSGGDDPAPSKSVSASSSPSSASPTTAAASEVPAAARAHTPEGAEAFVRYFYDEINRAWTSPEAGIVLQLGVSECQSCKAFDDTAAELVAKKHRYATRPVTVESARATNEGPTGQQYVAAKLHQHRVNIVDMAGTVISTDDDEIFDSTVALVWKGGEWKVFDTA
jgi:hypothetical protein